MASEILIDDETAIMTLRDFKSLGEYSTSLPSATVLGKRWVRCEPYYKTKNDNHTWYLGEYVECDKPDMCGIKFRMIIEITETDYAPGKGARRY